ncbi:hypothetical protein SK128_016657, partial [Halocaridina rubra]
NMESDIEEDHEDHSQSFVTGDVDKSETERKLDSSHDVVCKCHFCCVLLTGGIKSMPIDLKDSLPSSSLDPLSLLQCFGLGIISDEHVRHASNTRVCNKCYVVITECDILYPHLHAVVSKLREVWPEKLKGIRTLSFNVSFLNNEDDDSSHSQLVYKRKDPFVKTSDRKSTKYNEKTVSEDLFIPDVLLSFSYIKENNMVADTFKKLAKKPVETKVFRRKSYLCEFCNTVLKSAKDWSIHAGVVHKIIPKWQLFNLQSNLKQCIHKEVQWNDKQANICRRKLGISPVKRRCFACAHDFEDRSVFVSHLENFHSISLSIFSGQTDKAISSRAEKPRIKCRSVEGKLNDDPEAEVPHGSKIYVNILKKEKVNHYADKLPKRKSKLARNLISIAQVKDKGKMRNVKIMYTPHWRCRLCGEIFTSQNDFENHKRTKHFESTRVKKKKTVDIDDITNSNLDASKCPINMFPLKKVPCNICGLVFDNKDALKEHHSVTHERYGVVLEGDGQGGILDQRIKLPEEEIKQVLLPKVKPEPEAVATDIDEDKEIHACNICQEEFSSHLELIQHGCSAHENNPSITGGNKLVMIECKICQRRLHGANALRLHMSRTHKEHIVKRARKHECKMCLLEAQTKTKLMKHMKEKHDIDLMPTADCHICGKTVNAKYLERHIAIVHEKARNYPCNFCSMKFPSREYVKSHIYFEHANTKWKCEQCQLEFAKYHQLRLHRLNVHSNEVHACTVCGKGYRRKGDLSVHFKRCHDVREPHVCHLCPKSFLERSKLRNHLMDKHGMSWESTLSKGYARHLRENNCLTRRKWKSVRALQSKPDNEHSVTYNEDQVTTEEGYESTIQHENLDNPAKVDVLDKQLEEAEFSIVEVSEDAIGEISYIILEEEPA